MPTPSASVPPDHEELPRSAVTLSRVVWDQAVRDLRFAAIKRVVIVVMVVLGGALVGVFVPEGRRWPAIMVGVLIGAVVALWLDSYGSGIRSPAKREVVRVLMSAGLPRVRTHDLRRIMRSSYAVVHHRGVEVSLREGVTVITVIDLTGHYWGPRGVMLFLTGLDGRH